jgi:hypothetical protein
MGNYDDRKKGGFNLDDYVTVAERIAEFYAKFPEGSLQSEIFELSDNRVVIRAYAYRSAIDDKPAVAHSALAIPGSTPYTRGSEIENAETSAAGRAIAFLGFGVKKSVASRDEIQGKRDDGTGAAEKRITHHDGLIGKAVAQGIQDFQLRQGPDGPVLPFRIKEGRLSQIAVATGAIATALDTYRDETIGERITVWGFYTDESYDKKNKDGDLETIGYKVLHVERVKTPAFEMPIEVSVRAGTGGVLPDGTTNHPPIDFDAEPSEAESVPLFDAAESARLDAEEAAANA